VKKGFRVAICDQVEDPRTAKGIVRREVVRVVSPGTFTDANYLDAKEPAFLMAVAAGDPRQPPVFGVALLDVSTGEFTATEYTGPESVQPLTEEIGFLKPREIVWPGDAKSPDAAAAARELAGRWPTLAATGLPLTSIESWAFDGEAARRTLLEQLRAGGLE